jgi:hypothetical protein
LDRQEGFWNKEEFEELVATGLISMYETKLKKYRHAHSAVLVKDKILERVRALGCYFVPEDRIIHLEHDKDFIKATANQGFDVINDGRPLRSTVCHPIRSAEKDPNSMRFGAYLETIYVERIKEFPKGIFCTAKGFPYRIVNLWYTKNGIEHLCLYFIMQNDGTLVSCSKKVNDYDPITGRTTVSVFNENTNKQLDTTGQYDHCEDSITARASSTMQFYQDRRFLWNVQAREHKAKATFGVYPEQIKSLFYARSLPMSATGRKRPILHWVNAHQRRMKSGTDIDIDKYLRGTNEFIMDGTKFVITMPIKKTGSL